MRCFFFLQLANLQTRRSFLSYVVNERIKKMHQLRETRAFHSVHHTSEGQYKAAFKCLQGHWVRLLLSVCQRFESLESLLHSLRELHWPGSGRPRWPSERLVPTPSWKRQAEQLWQARSWHCLRSVKKAALLSAFSKLTTQLSVQRDVVQSEGDWMQIVSDSAGQEPHSQLQGFHWLDVFKAGHEQWSVSGPRRAGSH